MVRRVWPTERLRTVMEKLRKLNALWRSSLSCSMTYVASRNIRCLVVMGFV